MTSIYIAGPMESVGGNMNFPLFDEVSAKLRDMGHEVFSPADYARQHLGSLEAIQKLSKPSRQTARRQLLKDEIGWIIDNAVFVLMLPGWERSPGATAERAVALALGIAVLELDNIVPGYAGRVLELLDLTLQE